MNKFSKRIPCSECMHFLDSQQYCFPNNVRTLFTATCEYSKPMFNEEAHGYSTHIITHEYNFRKKRLCKRK